MGPLMIAVGRTETRISIRASRIRPAETGSVPEASASWRRVSSPDGSVVGGLESLVLWLPRSGRWGLLIEPFVCRSGPDGPPYPLTHWSGLDSGSSLTNGDPD